MSLRLWMPLNGDLTNNGVDNVNATLLGSTTYTNEGKIGEKALYTTANGQGVNLNAYMPTLSTFSNYTMCAWVYLNSTADGHSSSILSTGNWNQSKKQLCFALYSYTSDGYARLLIPNTIGWAQSMVLSTRIVLNKWYHIAITYDGTKTIGYVNGVKSGEYVGGGISTDTSLSNLYIGSATYTTGFTLKGKINDVRIYDNVLSVKEIKHIAQGLVLHLPLNNNGMGGKNLIPDSVYTATPWLQALAETVIHKGRKAYRVSANLLYSNTSNGSATIFPGVTFKANTQYTLSFSWIDDYRTDDYYTSLYIRIKHTDGTVIQAISSQDPKNVWTYRTLTSTAGKTVEAITTTYGRDAYMYISDIKLEEGTVATPFSPYENGNIEYDVSGYNNHGLRNNISYLSQSPRYDVGSVFNGSNSYIKITENNWMSQYAEEMTINLWAYSTNWASTNKLFSCTESGGWNTEAGNSGYARFSVYVATNKAKTSFAYRYNSKELKISDMTPGWHMITFIYNSEGNKVYLDGEPHSSCAFTSYGIKYNTNARLFLGCEANTSSPYAPYLNGSLSDFRIYYTTLSAEDIKELYNLRASITNSGDTLAYEFDENLSPVKVTEKGIIQITDILEGESPSFQKGGVLNCEEIIEF